MVQKIHNIIDFVFQPENTPEWLQIILVSGFLANILVWGIYLEATH